VIIPEAVAGERAGRAFSLRREWSRAFFIMLVMLLTAATATIVGVRGVVDEVAGTARQLHHESTTVAVLRTVLVDHEETAHQLLSDKPVDRAAFLAQQQQISRQFDDAVTIFPSGNGTRATVVATRQSWQHGLMVYGLWGDQVHALHGDHSGDNPTYGASSDDTVAMLNDLEVPSLAAMDEGLTLGTDLERLLIGALAGLFGLALAVTVYFRRRMATDLVHPVATLHRGVLNLQAGHYDHHIEVARRDELGELAEAFNEMAAALDHSHRALTLRATHDSLTGLANRATLTERLTASFGPGKERRAHQESLLFIDIDDFKNVNDSLGHQGGDALLTQLAARLTACVRPGDLVARLGGDEFAVVVLEDSGGSAAVEVAERILDSVRTPFTVTGTSLVVAVSIGVAQRRPETSDSAELLRQADFAMYMAKGGGKNRYQLFDAQMHHDMVGTSSLRDDLAGVVSSDQLRLDYQPVVDLHTAQIVGVEALVRWQHPTLGLLAPADFITLAEETRDIEAIGCWVLARAAAQAASWRRDLPTCTDLWVSVNLSAFQLPSRHSLAAIEGILADPATQTGHVVLEVTETALAADLDGGIAALNMLKSLGARIAIDDFGTGFSSLSALARLPVDLLKIDRSFVSGATGDAPSVPMLEGIHGLADKLSLAVIAEGIETAEQLDLLRTLGYRNGQGYFLARPAPPAAIGVLLAAGRLGHLHATAAHG
jgi:diguanylate cyclase (GGDEF)-like protein